MDKIAAGETKSERRDSFRNQFTLWRAERERERERPDAAAAWLNI